MKNQSGSKSEFEFPLKKKMINCDETEFAILRKYANGAPISEEDFEVLERYELIGFVHFGFSFSKWQAQARLTKLGSEYLSLVS
jgi:hypothetical protein